MDAYVFALSASTTAVETLKDGVGAGGPARVVCPLTGDLGLYVAVTAADEATLRERVAAVLATPGLREPRSYVATEGGTDARSTFPTHALVDAYVGFALADEHAVTAALAGAPTLVGLAVATDGTVIMEVTGDDEAELRQTLEGLPGTVTAVGATADGAGFRSA